MAWVYLATAPPVGAAGTASLLGTHQAIWCPPPGLHGVPVPNAGDMLWLVHRTAAYNQTVLLGGGIVMKAPRALFRTNVLWTDPDLRGIRAAATALGYGGGPAMSFLRLKQPSILDGPGFPAVNGLGGTHTGANVASAQQIAILAGLVPNAVQQG